MSPRTPRSAPRSGTREARRRPTVDPNAAPFSSFLERDQARLQRQRSRRRTFFISVAVHAVVLVGVLLYSVFQVDELFSPSVGVRVLRTSQLPKGVTPLRSTPDPAEAPALAVPDPAKPAKPAPPK